MHKICDFYLKQIRSQQKKQLKKPVENIIYPENCRYLYKDQSTTIAVIEQKPQTRSIYYENYYGVENDNIQRSFLSFPYMVFIITLDNKNNLQQFQVAYRNSPIKNIDDSLYCHTLSNIIDGPTDDSNDDNILTMCMGDLETYGSLSDVVTQIINHFWQTKWSDPPEISDLDLENWKRKTLKNPMFITKVKWKKYGSLKNELKKLIDYHGNEQFEANKFYANLYQEAILDTSKIEKLFKSEVEKAAKVMLNERKKKRN